MNKPIIVGLGGLGKAFFSKCSSKCIAAESYDMDPTQRPTKLTLKDAVGTDKVSILLCIPARGVQSLVNETKKYNQNALYISFAKGLDDNGRTTSEILAGLVDPSHFAIVGGPMLSSDLQAGRDAFAVVGAKDDGAAIETISVMNNLDVRSLRGDSPEFVALAGVLKNIYAIAFGISVGLHLGDNLKGALWTASAAEMEKILKFSGIENVPDSVKQLALFGDLFACDISETSRHKMIGIEIGQGGRILSGEGTHAAPLLKKRLEAHLGELPILAAVADIIGKAAVAQTIKQAVLQHYGS
jgi:glycerol-3-phosphate dehydrogenase (NAD(P)+)